jgi:hypothetical protein
MQKISDSAVLEDLRRRLHRLAPTQPCVWGSMNAQQMALHVGDASAAVLKEREFSSKPRVGPAMFRRVLVLYLMPQMPRGIKSGANPAATVVEPDQFGKDVERAANLLQRLAIAPADTLVERHPLLGPMTRAQWMRWAYLHTDHHLRQFGV